MSAKIKVKKIKNGVIVKIVGRLVSEDANKFASKLESFRGKSDFTVVIDMTELDYIDSHGLGVLVFAWKMYSDSSTKMRFYNPTGFVKDMFAGTKLDDMFEFVEDLENL